MGGMTAAAYDQAAFRHRLDTVGLTSTSWTTAQDTNFTQDTDELFRIRFMIQETAGGTSTNEEFTLEYRRKPFGGSFGSWTTLNTSSSHIQASNSGQFADGDTSGTDQQLGSGTFLLVEADENGVITDAGLDFSANSEAEMECCLMLIRADLTDGDEIEVRVTDGGTALGGYTSTPLITVNLPLILEWDQDSFRGRDDTQTLNSGTFSEALNTNFTQTVDEVFRMRFLIQEVGGGSGAQQFKLQYNLASGGWNDVSGTSPIQWDASGQYAHSDATTEVLGTGNGITFVGGDGIENATTTPSVTFAANEESEYEWALTIDSAQVTDAQTFQLRVVENDGTAFGGAGGYTNTPTITIDEPAVIPTNVAIYHRLHTFGD